MKKLFLGLGLTIAFASTTTALAPPWPSSLVIGNKGGDTISFINLETGRETKRRPTTDSAPHEIALEYDGYRIAVANYGGSSIDVFSPYGSRDGTIRLKEGAKPHGIIWLKNGNILVTAEGLQSVVEISGKGVFGDRHIKYIPTHQDGTHMIAASIDGRFAYTANMQSDTVSMIDLPAGRTLKSVAAGKEVEGIALAKSDSEVWTSIRGEDKVVIFDAKTLNRLAEIEVGKFPLRIVAHPDGKKMVTSNLMDGTISVIDIESRVLERTIKVSGSSDARQVTLLFSPDGSKLYAAETGVNKIAEIDFEQGYVIGRLSGGSQGDGLAIIPPSPW